MPDRKEYHSLAHTYLKAEAFCAEMMANGVPFRDIRLISNSNFKKSYRNEIDEVRFEYNSDNDTDELFMVVNKDGLYDRIPEGVFHQSGGNSKTSTTAQMTGEHRRFRDEERMARKFFQPLEQEFFRYATLVEQEEINLAFGLLNGDIKSELFRFWGIPTELPEEPAKKLVQLMPWANKIKGAPEFTAKALSYLLKKNVTVQVLEKTLQEVTSRPAKISEFELGINSVLGSSYYEPSTLWKFTIENVRWEEVAAYRASDNYGKLLAHFEESFIPVQIDIIFDFDVVVDEDPEKEDVLGYSLTL